MFSAELKAVLARYLPTAASASNPVDLAGAGEADLNVYADLCEAVLDSGEVDAVMVSGYLGCYGEDNPAVANAELAVVDRLGKAALDAAAPLTVHSMSIDSSAVRQLRTHGIATYSAVESCVRALAGAARLRESGGRDRPTPAPSTVAPASGYWAARGLLAGVGIEVPVGRAIRSEADLEHCADLTFPVVLKAGWLEHKSEHRGVVLGLASLAQLRAAYAEMAARLGDGEYVVEEQDARSGVVEMLIGARRDRDLGPVVVVGAGGTEAELSRDVCVELAPVDQVTALAMIDRLQCRPLLDGWRGRPAVDIQSLATALVAISEVIATTDAIDELELNPIRVAPSGALAVDALVITKPHPAPTPRRDS